MRIMEIFTRAKIRPLLDRWIRVLVFANVLLLFSAILLNVWAFRQVRTRGNADVQNALDRNLVDNCQLLPSSKYGLFAVLIAS